MPQLAALISEQIKFVNSQFRVGREMEATVEEFADAMKQTAAQPKGNPEADAAAKTAEMLQQKITQEMESLKAKTEADLKLKDQEATTKRDFANKEMEAKAQEVENDPDASDSEKRAARDAAEQTKARVTKKAPAW